MANPLDLVAVQFRSTHFVLKANLEGITQAESLRCPPAGGSSLNWVLGHVMASRNGILKMVGAAPVLDPERAALYRRGGSPPEAADDPVEVGQLLEALDASQEAILSGLGAMSAEAQAAPVANPANGRDEPAAQVLAGLAFHEAYHAGQTGTLRRAVGKEGVIR